MNVIPTAIITLINNVPSNRTLKRHYNDVLEIINLLFRAAPRGVRKSLEPLLSMLRVFIVVRSSNHHNMRFDEQKNGELV